jgi:hypothetical protein
LNGVLSLKSADEFQSAQLLHGSLVEIVRLITPEAVAASASPQRWSIAAEDSTNLSRSLFDGAARSSSVDDTFVHLLTGFILGRPPDKHRFVTVNVETSSRLRGVGNCSERSIWAPVPPSWEEFGFPVLGSDGLQQWFHLRGFLPGLREAGLAWQQAHDAFLLRLGFTRMVAGHHTFIRTSDTGNIFLVCAYIDDYWVFYEDEADWTVFHSQWSDRFASPTIAALCGHHPSAGDPRRLSSRCVSLLGTVTLGLNPDTWDGARVFQITPQVTFPIVQPCADSTKDFWPCISQGSSSLARLPLTLWLFVCRWAAFLCKCLKHYADGAAFTLQYYGLLSSATPESMLLSDSTLCQTVGACSATPKPGRQMVDRISSATQNWVGRRWTVLRITDWKSSHDFTRSRIKLFVVVSYDSWNVTDIFKSITGSISQSLNEE